MSVVEIAKSYLGKTEKPNNSGFNDQAFEKKMKEVGWEKEQAYCSYFCELCFKEADQRNWWKLEKLFSGSAVQTHKNFKEAGYVIKNEPFEGALAIYQKVVNGKLDWRGHAAICETGLDANKFYKTIDANTVLDNEVGNQREGYIVAHKKKKLKPVTTGLRPIGFIKVI